MGKKSFKDTEIYKKELQKNPELSKGNILKLCIVNGIIEGKNLRQIAYDLGVTESSLSYHVSSLKRGGHIIKKGYGVWSVVKIFNPNNFEKLSTDTNMSSKKITIDNVKSVSISKFTSFLKRNGLYKCVFCNHNVGLHIHHILPKGKGGSNHISNLIPVCPNHHSFIHSIGYSGEMKKSMKIFIDKINSLDSFSEDMVRGHAFIIKFRLKKNLKNWSKRADVLFDKFPDLKPKRFERGVGIVFRGRKVHLWDKSIVIYEKESFLAAKASESKSTAIYSLKELIRALESKLKADFTYRGGYCFTVAREHYSMVKNALAKQYNKDGEKLEVFNVDGLWMLIDNSYNLHELEVIKNKGNDAVVDSEAVQRFWNDHKKHNFEVTASFVLEMMRGIQENQGVFDANMKSHLDVLGRLGVAVDELRGEVAKLNKSSKK